MKIIYWHYPHLRFWMGGTKFIFEVAKVINNKYKYKYKLVIITNLGDKQVIHEFKKAGIEIKTTSFYCTNDTIYWLLFPIFFIYDFIVTLYLSRNSDIFIATLFPSNLLCSLISSITKKKYYCYCYEPFPFFHNKKFINSFDFMKKNLLIILSFLYSKADIWAIRQAKNIFTLNDLTKKMIFNIYKKNAIVTLMGVDNKHFKPYKRNRLKSKFKNKILITHSTDYTEMKKTNLAILVISKLERKFNNILLLITTTQPNNPNEIKYRNMVKELKLINNVKFLGFVSYKVLPLYYAIALCYLSCSDDKMLGTTSSNLPVKEAMSCGVPAIRASVTQDDVEDGISGFLVNPQDTDLICKKIIYLIKNPQKAKKMGIEGRKKIKKMYTWEKVTSKIIEFID